MYAILKSKGKKHQPKQAKTFEREELQKFLDTAPDSEFLLKKMAMVMGVMGACRNDELVNMKICDIEEKDDIVIVKIPNTKNFKPRLFVISNVDGFNGMAIYKKYVALRPKGLQDQRFFCATEQKCTKQPVGINTLHKIPRDIANFLKLPDASLYTGHSFRRTSATLLANASADVLTLKRHGGWRSSNVAESYVENSISHKAEIARKIISSNAVSESFERRENSETIVRVDENITEITTETEATPQIDAMHSHLANPVFNNCTVNINFYK